MKVKTCPVTIKAAGTQDGTDDGVFEAIVAAYNVDLTGDKIVPGAFADTLKEWKDSGDPIPVLWSHMSHDPDYHIGVLEDVEERPEGLWVKARLDLEEPKSAKVYKLLKGRRVTQFSFAYDILEGGWVDQKSDDGKRAGFYELRKLKLYEVGPTLIGANPATDLLDIKAGTVTITTTALADSAPPAVKAGRALSAKNETALRDALGKITDGSTTIETVLSALDKQDDAKAMPAPPAAAPSEPPPAFPGTASIRLRTRLAALAADADALTN